MRVRANLWSDGTVTETNSSAEIVGRTVPDPAEVAELRRVAVYVAETAAAHVRARRPEVFGPGQAEGGSVRTKSTPTDPVTVVDTETEQLIRALLAETRPGDGILGEEGGGSTGSAGEIVWVVDPIDGTVNFVYGIPAYSVSVAAVRGGRSLAGAVVDVAASVTYSAGLGAGATRVESGSEPVELRCNELDAARLALVATGFGYSASRRERQGELVARLLPRVRDIRRIGSAALDLCMVAAGRVDAHYEHGLNPWDWAAGALVAAEAGAVLRLPGVDSTGAGGELTVAAAPGIAAELAGLFDELGIAVPIPE
ncbi:inositol monophosphatase [Nocardia vermiculata]|uniref:inositol-phosphate phosphatase n=1 Tax=Nocardia vermiculata TaxID=257274 RepID=A0A846Y5V1_9NOCA|nr:inositol monophosphatase [Nocardia vermiculata]